MKAALDTNILAYVEGINGPVHQQSAIALVSARKGRYAGNDPGARRALQCACAKKSGWPGDQARAAILTWRDTFPLAPTTEAAMIAAADHRLGICDSLMVAVVAEAGCRLLLSEDMQDGFSWRGVTVVNPFAAIRHPLLGAPLGETGPPEP